MFNSLKPALHTPIPNTILHPRNGRLPHTEQDSSSTQTPGQLSCTQQHKPIQVGYKPGKPDLNRQSRRKMSCAAWHEQQIPGPVLCEAFSCVYISIHSSLKNGTAKETLLAHHQQGLRNPIILSAARLFTRRITRGATSVQGSLGRVNVCSSRALFLLQSRMWGDPAHVKAFKLRGG